LTIPPNGVVIEESAYSNPYLFIARAYDAESGLYYYRARYYDYYTGRFLQPDPIGYADGLSLYGYVGNNPANGSDPFGLRFEIEGNEAVWREAINYLKGSPTFARMYETLEASPEVYHVLAFDKVRNNVYHPNENADPGNNHVGERRVQWNPAQALATTTGGVQSAALCLAHELAHAYHHDRIGYLDDSLTGDNYVRVEEALTIPNEETWIANELGESTRTNAHGTYIPAKSVTDRPTPPPPVKPKGKKGLLGRVLDSLFGRKRCG